MSQPAAHSKKDYWEGKQNNDIQSLCMIPIKDFKAAKLTKIIAGLFPTKKKNAIDQWRKQYTQTHSKSSPVWDMIIAFWDAAPTFQDKKQRPTRPTPEEDTEYPHPKRRKKNHESEDFEITGHFHDLLELHRRKEEHNIQIAALEPVDGGDDTKVPTCVICFNSFAPKDVVFCPNIKESHPVCIGCMNRYCLETLPSVTLTAIPCPQCNVCYPKYAITSCLCEWDILVFEQKESNVNCRVALNKDVAMVLYCECGVVAVVEEKDKGSGIITCLCGRAYCIKCGNFEHPGRECPPPPETQNWLNKHSKPCPNCKQAIEKNGGCNHMTCHVRSGGCGHQFCWLCNGRWGECKCRIFS